MKGLLLLALLFITQVVNADTYPRPFDRFWKNAGESFSKNLPWHLTAIAATPVLVGTGVDAHVHTAFNGNRSAWSLPGVSAGYLTPFLVAVPLYAAGETMRNKKTLGAAYAVAQTTIITLSTVSLLKSFTGRPAPDNDSSSSPQRQSREFNFGFLNRGIYEGWPSGHMATVTSIASTLMHYYPEHVWLKYAGYSSMAYMLAMVSAEHKGQFHWFSDGVAGGLMGYAIGRTVGRNMRSHVTGEQMIEEKKTADVLPLLGAGRTGLQVVWTN